MNKKMIAIAVAAALPMAANAGVDFYGKGQVQLVDRSNDATGVIAGAADTRKLEDGTNSRFGLNASEDLGNGMTALAQFALRYDSADGGVLAHREQNVGLKGSFGTVRLGRNAGVYKGTNMDQFIATALEARNGGGNSTGAFGHNGFIPNTLKYSNKFGAVKFSALISLDDADNKGTGDNQVALDYKAGGLRLLAAVSNDGDKSTTTLLGPVVEDESRTKLAAQYKMGPWKFTAHLESIDNYSVNLDKLFGVAGGTFQSAVVDTDMTLLQADYTMGKNTFTLRLAEEDYDGATNDVTMVAFSHAMSKNTRIFAGIRDNDFEGWGWSATSVGMTVKF